MKADHLIFISHKHHEATSHTEEFVSHLEKSLSTLPSKYRDRFTLKLFFDASPENGFQAQGGFMQEQQDEKCEQASMAIILWNDGYETSTPCLRELSYFLKQEGTTWIENKPSINLLEHGRSQDMGEPYCNKWRFPIPDDQSLIAFWEHASDSQKNKLIGNLRETLCETISKL